MTHTGKYPDAFYRVTAKAIIKDDRGYILAVWDKEGFWNVPGGGIDHGDTTRSGLARELDEELGYSDDFTMEYIDTLTYYSSRLEYYCMHIFFDVKLADYKGTIGIDTTKAEFIDPSQFKDASNVAHQFIYKYGHDRQFTIPSSF
jgi:8-oxo-dGTP diphosphatase